VNTVPITNNKTPWPRRGGKEYEREGNGKSIKK
jgi:hypothetical protein